MRRSLGAAFPIGLYGLLLLAGCWLLLPELFLPVERVLLGIACLPQRWLAGSISPVFAAATPAGTRLGELQQALRSRAEQFDVGPAKALMPAAMDPLPCRVVAVGRIGGGGRPCELRLDRSYAELAGCADLVTKGDALLGFLARPGVGPAAADRPEDAARVLLLHHPDSRPVAAAIPIAPEGELRCVVAAAAVVDPAPLRTVLHEDPYRAARLQQGGAEVRTLALDAAWIGAVPGGLLLGRARIWGYERAGGDALTIGIYVDPPVDPRALSHVVVWQTVPEARLPERDLPRAPARLWPLPDGRHGRWLLTAAAPVPDGAAVVQDGVCVGRARSIAFGQGLVASLPASRHPWALWLLPDDPAEAPLELWGEVAAADATTAWFRPAGARAVPAAGFVFTGGNGPTCPAGLLLGRGEWEAEAGLLRVVVPQCAPGRPAEVVVEAP